MSDRRRDFESEHPCHDPTSGDGQRPVTPSEAGVGDDYTEPAVNSFPFEEEERRWLAPQNQVDFQMSIDQVSRHKTIINQSCFFMRYHRVASETLEEGDDPIYDAESRFIYSAVIPPATNPFHYQALQLDGQDTAQGGQWNAGQRYEDLYNRREFMAPEGMDVFGLGASQGERSLDNSIRMPGQFRWPVMSLQTNSQWNNDTSCDRASVRLDGEAVTNCRTKSIDAFRFCAGKYWFFNGHSAEFYSPELWNVPGSLFNIQFSNPTVPATDPAAWNGENRWYYKSPEGQVAFHERMVVDFFSGPMILNLTTSPGYGVVFNRPKPIYSPTADEPNDPGRDQVGLFELQEDDRNDEIMRERWRIQNNLGEGFGVHARWRGIKDQFHPGSFNPPFHTQQFRFQGTQPPASLNSAAPQTLIPSNNELYGIKHLDLARWIMGPFWVPPNRPTGLLASNAVTVPDDMFEIYTRFVCPGAVGEARFGCAPQGPYFGDYRARFHKKGLFGFGRSYLDTVHDTPMPFFTRESEAVNFNSQQNATIELKNNFIDGEYKNIQDELDLPNLYRQYSKFTMRAEDCVRDRHVKFTSRNIEQFKKAKDTLQYHFPMTVNIKFQTYQGSRAAGYFRKTGMDKYFLDFLSHLPDMSNAREPLYAEILDQRHVLESDRASDRDHAQEFRRVLGQAENDTFTIDNERRTVDLLKWIDSYLGNEVISNIEDREFPLRVFPKSEDDPSGQLSRESPWTVFLANLNKMVLKQELLEYSWDYSGDDDFAPSSDESEFPVRNKYFRCMEDIFKGKKAYSEVVAYKVEKLDASIDPAQGSQIVQTFYFFDSDQIQEIDFVDSQVVFGKTYIYRIYAYTLVIGTEYQYKPAPAEHQIQEVWSNLDSGDLDNRKRIVDFIYDTFTPGEEEWSTVGIDWPKIVMDVFSRPHLSIVEVPFHEAVIKVEDRPPTSPDVLFTPYKDIINKIRMTITAEPGEHSLVPIAIEDADEDIIQQMRASQDLEEDTVLYKTDDTPMFFEIFRTTKPPKSYRSFKDKKITTIATNHDQSVSINQFVEPNVKYYYTVRAVDELFFSNPTPVYCIELVHVDDGMFFNVDMYEFPTYPDTYKLPFRDRVLIRPARMQRAFDVASLLGQDLFPGGQVDPNTGLPPDTSLSKVKESIQEVSGFSWLPPPDWRPSLGLYDGEPEIYNQKFKFRITSRHTGKQIDINTVFSFDIPRFRPEDPTEYTTPDLCPPRAMINPESDPILEDERIYEREQEREPSCPEGFEQQWYGEGPHDFDCVGPPDPGCQGPDCDMDDEPDPSCPPGTVPDYDENGERICVPDDAADAIPEETPSGEEEAPAADSGETTDTEAKTDEVIEKAKEQVDKTYGDEKTESEPEKKAETWQPDNGAFGGLVDQAHGAAAVAAADVPSGELPQLRN